MRTFEKNDVVICPTGRRALVLSPPDDDGFVRLRYLDEFCKTRDEVTLLGVLLRRVRNGRDMPTPVRIDAHGRVH